VSCSNCTRQSRINPPKQPFPRHTYECVHSRLERLLTFYGISSRLPTQKQTVHRLLNESRLAKHKLAEQQITEFQITEF
jgi:hypothetical protein